MFNFKKFLFNPNLSKIIILLLYLGLSIFFSYYLFKSCVNHEAISKVIYSLVWLVICIFEVALKCDDIIKPSPPKEIDNQRKNQLFSKQWYSENSEAIILMLMGISVGIISLIIFTIYYDWNTNYMVNDPKFDTIGDWCYILLGLCFLSDSLKKIPKFQKVLNSKFSHSLRTITFISAFIMYILWVINLKEVP